MTRTALLLILVAATFCLQPGAFAGPEADRSGLDEAARLAEQGSFQAAHDAYGKIARDASGTASGDEASFRSAFLFLSSRNPGKDYVLAEEELKRYLEQYPHGAFIDEASAWVDALETLGPSRVNELKEQVASLTLRLKTAVQEREQTARELDKAAGERAALIAERNGLQERLTAATRERDGLLQNVEAVTRERDRLDAIRASQEKKIDALTKQKVRLTEARDKLEKRLRDLTAVDVRMEKRREQVR